MAENTTEFMWTSKTLSTVDSWNSSRFINTTNSSSPGRSYPIGSYGQTRELLWKIIPPFLIAFGTTGNILTGLVIFYKMKKASSTSLYLLTLAISDTAILWCGPLRNWVSNVWDKDIRFLSDSACKVQLYFTYATIHFSSWLLVAVTMERTICVVLPHKVKISCTRRNAGIVIMLLFLFTFGINIVIPVTQGLEGYEGKRCSPTTKEYLDFRNNIWQWIDFCMAFAIPFIFLLSGNSIIIVYLYKSQTTRKDMFKTCRQRKGRSGREKTAVYVLMVALCSLFLLTMTPVTVYQIYYPYRFREIKKLFETDPNSAFVDYQYLLLQHTIVNLVGYTNAAFNFVLYVFSGSKFRTGLIELFRGKVVYRKPGVFGINVRTHTEENRTKTTGLSVVSFQKEINSQEVAYSTE